MHMENGSESLRVDQKRPEMAGESRKRPLVAMQTLAEGLLQLEVPLHQDLGSAPRTKEIRAAATLSASGVRS